MAIKKSKKLTSSTHTQSNLFHIPLGLFGLSVWFFVSLVMLSALVMFIWNTIPQTAFASGNTQSSPVADIFGAIPEFASSIGFTQGQSDDRSRKLERFLIKQGSPMAGHAETFIRVADACPMDWALLPAIAGKESAYGRLIPPGSFNAFGWAIYTGETSGAVFQNWDHAIERVGQGLCENYINNGRVTPEQIEQLYTPLSAQTHGGWRTHVTRLMEQIKATE